MVVGVKHSQTSFFPHSFSSVSFLLIGSAFFPLDFFFPPLYIIFFNFVVGSSSVSDPLQT